MSVQLHPDIEQLDRSSLCYSIYSQLYHNFFNAQEHKSAERPIDATIRDTVIIWDSMPRLRQKVEMRTPHIELSGIIENDRLQGSIRVPVTLHQAVWIWYRRRWIFWKRVRAIHQTILSDSPYVEIKYSEYIQMNK